jgi:cell wall assembly regulator SMI1
MVKTKPMTVANLHKQLAKMVESGQGWMKVCIDKSSFNHPLEGDGATILNVKSADHHWVPLLDDDGGSAMRKDGAEKGSMCFVLDGGQR